LDELARHGIGCEIADRATARHEIEKITAAGNHVVFGHALEIQRNGSIHLITHERKHTDELSAIRHGFRHTKDE
jgi:hypothetical protein